MTLEASVNIRRRIVCLILIFGSAALCAARDKREVVRGRIVVYNVFPACLNGNSYYSMIVRLAKPEKSSKFIQVHFSQPCSQFPKWLDARSSVQKFTLIRDKSSDAVLQEFLELKNTDEKDPTTNGVSKVKNWKVLAGGENEHLPFGEVVRSYRLADLPLVPAL